MSSSISQSPMLHRAGQWFLHSGIQSAEGGVSRYCRLDTGNLPDSTEITGYSVSALAWLHNRTGRAEYLSASELAAGFLTTKAWHPEMGLFPFEISYPWPPAYFFDCGIIIRGLLALWRINGQQLLLDIATACAYGMRRTFRARGGMYHPIVTLPHYTPKAYQHKWSQEPGCFQLKSALAWVELSEITGDTELRQWFDEALTWAVQNSDQFLPGSADELEVMNRLHSYTYYLEALLKRPELHGHIAAGVAKATAILNSIAPRFERSDVCAQLLRVSVLAGLDRTAAADLARRAARYQFAEDSGIDRQGGFCFGSREGVLMPMVNPVSTAFCMQALDMWQTYEACGNPGALAELI